MQVLDTAQLGPVALELVTQDDPTGYREFRTTLSDSQGALVIHIGQDRTLLTNAGGWVNGAVGRLPAAGQDTTATVPIGKHPLPLADFQAAVLDEVFGALVESVFEQPGPLLPSGDADSTQWEPARQLQPSDNGEQWEASLTCLACANLNVGGSWDVLDSALGEE